jgi:hypothetical protein
MTGFGKNLPPIILPRNGSKVPKLAIPLPPRRGMAYRFQATGAPLRRATMSSCPDRQVSDGLIQERNVEIWWNADIRVYRDYDPALEEIVTPIP